MWCFSQQGQTMFQQCSNGQCTFKQNSLNCIHFDFLIEFCLNEHWWMMFIRKHPWTSTNLWISMDYPKTIKKVNGHPWIYHASLWCWGNVISCACYLTNSSPCFVYSLLWHFWPNTLFLTFLTRFFRGDWHWFVKVNVKHKENL